jgi:hypothetical protein
MVAVIMPSGRMNVKKSQWMLQKSPGFPRSLCTGVASSRRLQSDSCYQDLIMLGIETSCDDTGVAVV